VAFNGVPLRNMLDFGILHNDTEYALFAIQQAAALPVIANRGAPYKIPFPARPYPEPQIPLEDDANGVQQLLHKEQFKFIEDFYNTLANLENALLNHVDAIIFEQLKVARSHINVGLPTMITFLDNEYGTLLPSDLIYLHQQYRINFSSSMSLSAQISQMNQHFAIIELRAPTESVRPSDKIRALIQNIQSMDPHHVQQLTAHITRYNQDHPTIVLQTYETFSAYLITRFIPDVTSTTSSIGLAHAVSKTSFNKTEVEEMIKTAVQLALKQQQVSTSSTLLGSSKSKGGKDSKQQFTRDTSALYCFVHGYQKSHKGSDCKIMIPYKEFCGQAMAATQPTKFHNLISSEIGLNEDQTATFKELVKAHKST
jgi:hypothetical protein